MSTARTDELEVEDEDGCKRFVEIIQLKAPVGKGQGGALVWTFELFPFTPKIFPVAAL